MWIVLLAAAMMAGDSGASSAAATAPRKAPRVVLETTRGNIVIELDAEKAPLTVKNFLDYVAAGHYDGTVFHRVIPDFMIQGGGFTADMAQKPTKSTVKNESNNGLRNARGTIAMARLPHPDSATAQFFINHGDNASLNAKSGADGYTVFGKVVEGMDVVDAIAKVRTGNKGQHQNVPVEPITITRARVQP
jgi:cyclophilin family peptidyl-prolyl cis-trans isomerase